MPTQFRLITKQELRSILGVSRATIERLTAEKRLPRPYKLGKRTVRWRSDEIESYLNELTRMDDAYARHSNEKGGAA